MDAGREAIGVVEGVPFGVEFALPPARAFRAEERGVTLLATKPFTGVASSWAGAARRGVVPTALRAGRAAGVLATEGASRGATGVLEVRVVARVGFSGRAVLVVVRSMGMVRGGEVVQWVRQRVRGAGMAVEGGSGRLLG